MISSEGEQPFLLLSFPCFPGHFSVAPVTGQENRPRSGQSERLVSLGIMEAQLKTQSGYIQYLTLFTVYLHNTYTVFTPILHFIYTVHIPGIIKSLPAFKEKIQNTYISPKHAAMHIPGFKCHCIRLMKVKSLLKSILQIYYLMQKGSALQVLVS